MAARRMGIMGLLLCLCLLLMPCSAQAMSTADAKEAISPERACDLTLIYRCEGEGIADVPVKLYRIAEVSADAQYTLTAPFRDSGLVLNGVPSVGEWDVIRTTLESYILANAIEADVEAETNQDGMLPLEALTPGLYLAASVYVVLDDCDCFFDSTWIALPELDEEGHWNYVVTAAPKPEVLPPLGPDDKDETQYKVLKLWKDEGSQAARPRSVQVEIFRKGEHFQTVNLSEDNHWSYTWTAAAEETDWMVVERDVPAGYSAAVEERTTTFILTNTYDSDVPSEEVPPADSPKTGDTSNILLYLVLLYVSGAGLILLGITGKRNRV